MSSSWVYVLCDGSYDPGNGYFYVGSTRRLFTRFKEHAQGKGSNATSSFNYPFLVALYKTDEENRYTKENEITLQLMKLNSNPYKIRGGSWTNHGLTKNYFKQPTKLLQETCMPVVCKCNMPCISFYKNKKLYFQCSLQFHKWIYEFGTGNDEEINGIILNTGCDFMKEQKDVVQENEPNTCDCGNFCGNNFNCSTCVYKSIQTIQNNRIPSNIKIVDEDN
jgi:predicted GIY-YIG superfamily endonuclease